ncbi:NAD(P)-dependent dehydrogenase, short-chain alcohol dehydrogenase family [Chitinophaga jiangningensis]|uniref:NAD(P)-dependent dehydrogenase, short-chain alcohol dehydrogenase family n=1 Tax=Chitinophaga jiangningensis TaxID=1419482 RepID=A0A1M6YCK6_9BACT|nr:SDR family NAD(P)-dependent oxidoreductase [Chitinophaga jiangningensis]SHL15872.1 NAD(P)-dependent dehydrogenase, short-chain alcohol dehydrogenase family [Chitinophaga jiangningensis]
MNPLQQPIQSRFNASSTASEVAAGHQLHGKNVVVTGGSAGIGFEIVQTLSRTGANVVVGARNAAKANEKLAGMPNVSFIPLDLADPASVDAFAHQYLATQQPLHFLFNNAGVFFPPERKKDMRGYELQFGANHLGHFQLTGLLWPALKNAGGAKVISHSSVGHRRMGLQLDDPNFEQHPYDPMKAYAQSKTANALFAVHLNRLGQSHRVSAYSVHPGAILTDVVLNLTDEELEAWKQRVKTFKSAAQGAATAVWCALGDELNGIGGVYCEDCNIAPFVPDDPTIVYGVRAYAADAASAAELWQFSENATGIKWPS